MPGVMDTQMIKTALFPLDVPGLGQLSSYSLYDKKAKQDLRRV